MPINFMRRSLFRSFGQAQLHRLGPRSIPANRLLTCGSPRVLVKAPYQSSREAFQTSYNFELPSTVIANLGSDDDDHIHRFAYFHGDHDEFLSRIQNGAVILFFYKSACSPCAVLESKIKSALREHHLYTEEESTECSAEGSLSKPSNRSVPSAFTNVSSVSSSGGGSLNKFKSLFTYRNDGASLTSNSFKECLCAFLRIVSLLQPRIYPDKDGSGATTSGVTTLSKRDGDFNSMKMKVPSVLSSGQLHKQEQINDSLQFALTKSIRFLAINTDENARLTSLHDIRNVPTFLAYLDGCIIAITEGANEMGLCRLLRLLSEEAENQKKRKEI